jgi:hypothetical protein
MSQTRQVVMIILVPIGAIAGGLLGYLFGGQNAISWALGGGCVGAGLLILLTLLPSSFWIAFMGVVEIFGTIFNALFQLLECCSVFSLLLLVPGLLLLGNLWTGVNFFQALLASSTGMLAVIACLWLVVLFRRLLCYPRVGSNLAGTGGS